MSYCQTHDLFDCPFAHGTEAAPAVTVEGCCESCRIIARAVARLADELGYPETAKRALAIANADDPEVNTEKANQ